MKKLFALLTMLLALSVNANALYISGSAGTVSGEDDYKGTNVNVLLGLDTLAIEPSWKHYTAKDISDYDTYALRIARETNVYTLGVYGGMTPDVDEAWGKYSNQFVGADFTI